MKRMLGLALALAMVFSLAGCGKEFDEGKIREGVCYEATGISPDAVAMKVDGASVPMDMYFYNICYAASYMQNFMTMYGMDFDWDMDLGDGMTVYDAVKQSALENTKGFAVIEKLAKENNVVLDEDALKAIDTKLQQVIDDLGGEENYAAELAKIGLREETYDRMRRSDSLYDALKTLYATEGSSLYASDDTLLAYAEEQGYMTADHILLLTKDMSTYQELDAETAAQKKELADEIKAKLDAYTGDDIVAYFTELADEYSEDSGREGNPDGYTFGSGQMAEEFEDTAAALGENEISEVVKSSYGYHIILRKPLDAEKAVDMVRDAYFEDMMNQATENAEVTINPAVEALDVKDVYEGFLAAQEATEPETDAQDTPNSATAGTTDDVQDEQTQG